MYFIDFCKRILAENPDKINNMKMACIKKAEVYDADNAMKILLDRMEAKI